ncbi:MAG TPA: 5-formyltetrahydrofolate cyclo-ligase [Propionibacteriaceae bacterium]|nr:5-formyltetrahydrofolate cyclo-ligase [Propionibacteriaceae bacterium]
MVDSQQSDAAAVRQAKRLLRHAVLLSRESRSPTTKSADDHARFEQLRGGLQRLPAVRTVAAYLSTPAEPGTLELIGWLASQDVRVLLPALSSDTAAAGVRLDWAAYGGPDQLRLGPFSIVEPTTSRLGPSAIGAADVVICSGLAATTSGDRLGRGGGWYDAALSAVDPAPEAWVLLNDDELLEVVPTDPWDRPVDAIVTQTRLIQTRANDSQTR